MIYPQRIEDKIGFTPIRSMVAERCVSPLGAAKVAAMEFVTEPTLIMCLLRSTDEMRHIVDSDTTLPIDGLQDTTGLLRQIVPPGTFLAPKELLTLRGMLSIIVEISRFFAANRNDEGVSRYPELDRIAAGLSDFPELLREIDRVLDKYGNIKDNASPELSEIRAQLRSVSGTINTIMRRVLARAVADGIVESGTTPSVRDGRLVIPVAPMHKRHVNGIVHDESASGKTVFIEPAEVVEANNRVRELEMDERREIARIMIMIADVIRPDIPSLLDSADILGELDFIRAKAIFAILTGGTLPSVADRPELEWYHACHPVLKLSLERHSKEIVPLDITLDNNRRLLIISGPNAGGKSVCLKAVGTLQYMLQCGLLPPVYDNSHFGIFDSIMADIGDDQSIEDDLSTYSSHLRNMKFFLYNGNSRSLILIDEFGSGTEPQIGGAIAQALLKRFNEMGMWGVITTHYQNLKHFAEDNKGLVNGSMLYDRQLMQPMFRLSIGNPGSSFAIEIARKTGLPKEIIDEAAEIVGSDYVNLDRYLLDIARDKRYWENKRQSIRLKEKKIDAVLDRYEQDAEALRQNRRAIIEDARTEARRILEGSNASIERTIHDIRRAQADREKTLEARRRLQEERRQLEADDTQIADSHPLLKTAGDIARKQARKKPKAVPAPPPAVKTVISVGNHVKLDGQGTVGTVLEINGKKATVAFGMLKTAVDISRLTPTLSHPDSGARKSSFLSSSTTDLLRDRQLKFKPEIDVRGMRVDEATQAITYFIDDALQFNTARVRILHGTGTGALRQTIRQYLSTVSGVIDYHDEDVRLGGAGITVVDLEH